MSLWGPDPPPCFRGGHGEWTRDPLRPGSPSWAPDAPSLGHPPHHTPAPESSTSRLPSASENQSPFHQDRGQGQRGTWWGQACGGPRGVPPGDWGSPELGGNCVSGRCLGWLTRALGMQLARCRSGGHVGWCQGAALSHSHMTQLSQPENAQASKPLPALFPGLSHTPWPYLGSISPGEGPFLPPPSPSLAPSPPFWPWPRLSRVQTGLSLKWHHQKGPGNGSGHRALQ